MKSLAQAIAISALSMALFGILAPQLFFALIVAVASASPYSEVAGPYLISGHLALSFCIAPPGAALAAYVLSRKPSALSHISDDAKDLYEPSSPRMALLSAALALFLSLVIAGFCSQSWLIMLPFSFTGQ
jgi:hypothetical protein